MLVMWVSIVNGLIMVINGWLIYCPLFYPISPSILLKTRSIRPREGPGRRYFATDPRKKQVLYGAVVGDGRMWHGEVIEKINKKWWTCYVKPSNWVRSSWNMGGWKLHDPHPCRWIRCSKPWMCRESTEGLMQTCTCLKARKTAVCSSLYMIVRWHVHCFVLNQNSWLIYACFIIHWQCHPTPTIRAASRVTACYGIKLELSACWNPKKKGRQMAPGNTGGVSRWKLHGVPVNLAISSLHTKDRIGISMV